MTSPYYKPGHLAPLSNDELEKHEEAQDLYEQNQATVRELIYRTVDKSTFLQVKGKKTADLVWKKLISIHADKGGMYETDLLAKLQSTHYTEGESMRDHLTAMTELKERLAEMNVAVSDESFVTYIQTSLSLAPTYRPLFIALSAAARKAGKPLTSSELIWHLTEEAASTSIEDGINKSNAAMVTQRKGKGKGKGNMSSSKSDRHCTNCGADGHTKEHCWEKGGGEEGKAPDWWKSKAKGKKGEKKKGSSGANVAEKPEDDSSENYAFLATRSTDDEEASSNITACARIYRGLQLKAHTSPPTEESAT